MDAKFRSGEGLFISNPATGNFHPAFPARDELLSPIGESAARVRDGVRSNGTNK